MSGFLTQVPLHRGHDVEQHRLSILELTAQPTDIMDDSQFVSLDGEGYTESAAHLPGMDVSGKSNPSLSASSLEASSTQDGGSEGNGKGKKKLGGQLRDSIKKERTLQASNEMRDFSDEILELTERSDVSMKISQSKLLGDDAEDEEPRVVKKTNPRRATGLSGMGSIRERSTSPTLISRSGSAEDRKPAPSLDSGLWAGTGESDPNLLFPPPVTSKSHNAVVGSSGSGEDALDAEELAALGASKTQEMLASDEKAKARASRTMGAQTSRARRPPSSPASSDDVLKKSVASSVSSSATSHNPRDFDRSSMKSEKGSMKQSIMSSPGASLKSSLSKSEQDMHEKTETSMDLSTSGRSTSDRPASINSVAMTGRPERVTSGMVEEEVPFHESIAGGASGPLTALEAAEDADPEQQVQPGAVKVSGINSGRDPSSGLFDFDSHKKLAISSANFEVQAYAVEEEPDKEALEEQVREKIMSSVVYAEAKPVLDRSLDGEDGAKTRKRRRIWIIFGVVTGVVCLVLGVALGVVFSRPKDSNQQPVVSSSSASSEETIRLNLLAESGILKLSEAFADPRSRQSSSFNYLVRLVNSQGLALENIPEAFALINMFFAMGGNNWTNNEGWVRDGALCDWYGVECDANQTLYALDLTNNNLTGEIPDEVFMLRRRIERFTLSDNNITGLIPAGMGGLTRLSHFDVSSNQICGAIPNLFQNLRETMESFDISHNIFTGEVDHNVFVGFNALTNLDLSHNLLQGGFPLGAAAEYATSQSLEYLPNLRYLNVEGNWMVGPFPSNIAWLKSLQEARFDSNFFGGRVGKRLCNRTLSVLEVDCVRVNCTCGCTCGDQAPTSSPSGTSMPTHSPAPTVSPAAGVAAGGMEQHAGGAE